MASTQFMIFPFDLFGNAGTGAGAKLLGDAIGELIQDVEEESKPSRSQSLQDKIAVQELGFDTMTEIRNWRQRGKKALQQILDVEHFPIMVSGNHLGCLPVYDLLGSKDLVVVLDAHLDLQQVEGTIETLSHGNFLRSLGSNRPKILHVGDRDLFHTQAMVDPIIDHRFTAERVHQKRDRVWREISQIWKPYSRIWLDLDCDVFDPVYCPGVQDRLPFGLTPHWVWQLIQLIPIQSWIGWSISEFDPARDDQDRSMEMLMWLIERSLLHRCEKL
jgi:agmatinase